MPVNSFENYPMSWKPTRENLKAPLYKTLAALLELDIKSGKLKAGDMLPPQRELADFLDVNLSTITRAFKVCELKGLISATTGKGTFISSDAHVSAALLCSESASNMIDMGAAHPLYEPNQMVVDFIKKVIKKVNFAPFLRYSAPMGQVTHRMAAAKWLRRFHVEAQLEQIMITAGTQNALAIILSSIFQTGDKIGVAELSYPAFKTLAKMLGIRLIPISLDQDGIVPESMEQVCKNEGLKAIYCIPECHNPTTCSMTLQRRQAVADLAKKYNVLILEDAINTFMGDLDATPLAALAPEQTLHICSVAKSLCAGLRIAFLVVPPKYCEAVHQGIYNIDMMTAPINMEIVAQLIEAGIAERVMQERRVLAVKRNQLTDEILAEYEVEGTCYNNYRWLRLPNGWTGKLFEEAAFKRGVQVFCAERFAVGSGNVPAGVRIGICAPSDEEELTRGLTILNDLLKYK